MSFDEKTIKSIAKLSRLHFPETEEAKFAQDINGILQWVEELKEVNVDGIDPLVSVTPRTNAIRKDEVIVGDIQAELMENAPESVQGFYVVPKMVE